MHDKKTEIIKDDSFDNKSQLDMEDFYDNLAFRVSPTDELWHYTSERGIMGILQKGNPVILYATRSDCLNDSSEGTYIIQVYQEVCESLYNSKRISRKYYELIKNISPNKKQLFHIPSESNDNSSNQNSYVEHELFICCFSTCGDSLEMWRYYSKGELGFSLQISDAIQNAINEKCGLAPKDKTAKVYLCKVIYNTNKQKRIIRDRILKLYRFYAKMVNRNEQEYFDKKTISILRNFLTESQYCFKHPCFSTENEVRLIIKVPKNYPNTEFEIKYRIASKSLIPYIELKPSNEFDLLVNVKISPFAPDETIATINKFLELRGFRGIKAEKSKLPVRF